MLLENQITVSADWIVLNVYLCGDVVQETMYTVMFSPEDGGLIEDEMDADDIREALAEYRSNPGTFSFDEEMGRLGLE